MHRYQTVLALLMSITLASFLLAKDKAGDESRDPKKILRDMSDFLASHDQFTSHIKSVMSIEAQGMNTKMTSDCEFSIARPTKLAMHVKSDANRFDIVCNEKNSFANLPPIGSYMIKDPLDDVDEILQTEIGQIFQALGPAGQFMPVGRKGYYDRLMQGVTQTKYQGEDTLNDVDCHHCAFEQEDVSWEIWIRKGDQPVPMKVRFDLSKQMQNNPMMANAKMDFYTLMSDWNFAPKFKDDEFDFTPPEDAKRVNNMFDGLMGDRAAQPHALLGKPAPIFSAKNLADENVELKKVVGKEIVILDFWATWCGPCVRALPEITEVAEEYKDKGIRFFAVNVGEDPDTIKEFLESQKLDIEVLLDADGEASEKYEVEGIPQTVIIGKDATTQVVHIGASPGLKQTLRKELDSLLEGKNLAAETLKDFEEQQKEMEEEAEAFEAFGTKLAWERDGQFHGLAIDNASGTIFATLDRGVLMKLDQTGKPTAEKFQANGSEIRLANLVAGDEREIISFDPWGTAVEARNSVGQELWSYDVGHGVDDVWAHDLDGDGADEVIIGYNGTGGLHVLDRRGKLKWKDTSIGNVWHVAAGNVDDDKDIEVVTTSARGMVHIFSPEGKNKHNRSVPLYANMVRISPKKNDTPSKILAAGSADRESMVMIDGDGKVDFQLDLPAAGDANVDNVRISETRPWAAVAMRGGYFHVVDLDQGKRIASVSEKSLVPSVGWLERDNASPLMVVTTATGIKAFEIVNDQ